MDLLKFLNSLLAQYGKPHYSIVTCVFPILYRLDFSQLGPESLGPQKVWKFFNYFSNL